MRSLVLCIAIAGCSHREPAPVADPPPPAPAGPRCIRAGGTCVGPAAIAANPAAPCAPGMHRVDDVTIAGDAVGHAPACFGIPLGEEACCMPDAVH
jgi:hypothetical protein